MSAQEEHRLVNGEGENTEDEGADTEQEQELELEWHAPPTIAGLMEGEGQRIMDSSQHFRQALRRFKQIIKDDPGNSHAHYGKGYCLLMLGIRKSDARNAFKKVIDIETRHDERNTDFLWRAHYNGGLASPVKHLKDFKGAIKDFDKADEYLWEYDPTGNHEAFAWIHTSKCNSYRRRGAQLNKQRKYDEAITCYDTALAMNPQDSIAYRGKAYVLWNQEQYDEAVECTEAAAAIEDEGTEDDNSGLDDETAVLMDTGSQIMDIADAQDDNEDTADLEELKIRFESVIAQDPGPGKQSDAYYYKGRCLYKLGYPMKESRKAFQKAIDIENARVRKEKRVHLLWQAYSNKGQVLAKLKKYEDASQCFDGALHYARADKQALGWIYVNKGDVLNKQADPNGAIECYDNALGYMRCEHPDSVTGRAYRGKGAALEKQGNYDEAIAYFDHTLELSPQDSVAYRGKADALHYKGEYTEAIKFYDKAIELDPKDSVAYKRKANAVRKHANEVDQGAILACMDVDELKGNLNRRKNLDAVARMFDEVCEFIPVHTLEENEHWTLFPKLDQVISNKSVGHEVEYHIQRHLATGNYQKRAALTMSFVRLFNWLAKASGRFDCADGPAQAAAMTFRKSSKPNNSIQILVDIISKSFKFHQIETPAQIVEACVNCVTYHGPKCSIAGT